MGLELLVGTGVYEIAKEGCQIGRIFILCSAGIPLVTRLDVQLPMIFLDFALFGEYIPS